MRAIETVLVAKTAAMSCYYATGDPRVRYVSPRSLAMIFRLCEPRFRGLGINDARQFEQAYASWRLEVEVAIEQLVARLLAGHRCSEVIAALLRMPSSGLRAFCLTSELERSPDICALVSLSAWLLATNGASAEDMWALAARLMEWPVSDAWGGLMAVICCASTDDRTLQDLLAWLAANENGAYLTKLIMRAPSASPQTRVLAMRLYEQKEVLKVA
jgi:hypothetical protein